MPYCSAKSGIRGATKHRIDATALIHRHGRTFQEKKASRVARHLKTRYVHSLLCSDGSFHHMADDTAVYGWQAMSTRAKDKK